MFRSGAVPGPDRTSTSNLRIGLLASQGHIANNVNQLAKWANINRVLPDSFESAIGDIGRATAAVTEAAQSEQSLFNASLTQD
jgi:hypothetical protein